MESLQAMSNDKYDPQGSYLVFSVNKQLFALPYQKIISVLDNPTATMMPGMDAHTRGVMDFMGKPVTLYDFRKITGILTMNEEIETLDDSLMKRKQDHLNWIAKLKDAVNSGSEITVETNPHKCAFGKWYDSFHTDNLGLSKYLEKFDAPHKHIHGIATRAKDLIAQGDVGAAMKLIDETENRELAELLRLFDGAKAELKRAHTEYAIVVHADDSMHVALAVDEPKYFGVLNDITYPLPKMVDREAASFVDAYGVLRSEGTDAEILIVELDKILCCASPGFADAG